MPTEFHKAFEPYALAKRENEVDGGQGFLTRMAFRGGYRGRGFEQVRHRSGEVE
jgi:hypothetical protein